MQYIKPVLMLIGLVLLLASLFVGGQYAYLSVIGLAVICLANAWANWRDRRGLAIFSLAAAVFAAVMVLMK